MPYEKVTVTGVKGFDKSIDGGPSPRSGTLFVEEVMDTTRNAPDEFKFGRASTSYACGFELAMRVAEAKFPAALECNFERVNDGKGKSKTVVTDVRVQKAAS